MKPLNIGIAGFGMSGRIFQVPFLQNKQKFRIKKVYERTSQYSREFVPEATIVRTYDELLTEDIDVIVISTPNRLHYEMAKQAIKEKKHVIVEKPLAVTVAEARELYALAQEYHVVISPYQNRRFDGGFLTAKQLMEEGQLGEVVDYEVHFDRYSIGKNKKEWKETGEDGVGILYDLGVHLIDQAVSIFGRPDYVYADIRKVRPVQLAEDDVQVYMYYANKKVILSMSQLVRESGPHIMVHGTKGSFVKYGLDVQEQMLLHGIKVTDTGYGMDDKKNYGILHTQVDEKVIRCEVPTVKGNYEQFHDNFYAAVMEAGSLCVTREQAITTLEVIERAKESAKLGRKIKL